MSYFLVFDTCTAVCSVALYNDNQLIGKLESYLSNSHAAVLPNFYIQLLLNANIRLADVSAIAFANGPGSYTGLRIGLATVKAICWAHDLPLICFSSLDAFAYQVQEQAIFHKADICSVIDARRMEIYCAIYDVNLKTIQPVEARIISEDWLADYPKNIIFAGNGYSKWLHNFPHKHFIPSGLQNNSVHGIGNLLTFAYQNKNFTDWTTVEPNYIKDVHITKKIV